MKDIPTSGPIARSNTHHALDTRSSRHSLSRSHRNADLGERKKYLFKVPVCFRHIMHSCERCQLLNSAFSTHPPTTEQHEPVAEARSVADLMNRQKECPPSGRVHS